MATSKACSRCGKSRPAEDFHRHSGRRDGLMSHCKDCYTNPERWYRGERRYGPSAPADPAAPRARPIRLTAEQRALVEANRGLAGHIAKRYLDRGLSLDEMVAAGFWGLCLAAVNFDPRLGVKFCSYAGYWVRREILLELQNNRIIRLPRWYDANGEARKAIEAMKALEMFSLSDFDRATDLAARREGDDPRLGLMQDAIRDLPSDYRDVVERRLAGQTFARIALDYDVSKTRIRAIFRGATDWLRRRMTASSPDAYAV